MNMGGESDDGITFIGVPTSDGSNISVNPSDRSKFFAIEEPFVLICLGVMILWWIPCC